MVAIMDKWVKLMSACALLISVSRADAGGGFFKRFNGPLLSCTSQSSLVLRSVVRCATYCLSLAGDSCIGFNFNENSTSADNLNDSASDQQGVGACSTCVFSENNNRLVNDSVNENSWFYWLMRSPMLTEAPLGEYINITNGLHAGEIVLFYGYPTGTSNQFIIDFMDSSKELIALRVAAKIKNTEKYIVLRSKNPDWGYHLKIYDPFPLKVGTQFEIAIFIDADAYFIYVNEFFIYEFPHEFSDLADIRYIFIEDAVQINGIVFG